MMALDADTGLVEASDDSDDDDVFSPEDGDGEQDPDSSTRLVMTRQSSNQTIQPTQLRLGRLRFSILLRTILQDTQTRLVFRAQAVIQSQVLHYVPTSEDLDYPLILEKKALASGKEPLWKLEDLDESNTSTPAMAGSGVDVREKEKRFRIPNETQMKWWFPTLRRTVWVLARLNTFVNVSSTSLSLPMSLASNSADSSPCRTH